MPDLPSPPIAARILHTTSVHGDNLEDPYAWLRDAAYPEVTDERILKYLRAENSYFECWKAAHASLVETIFDEMKGRIKDDDASVPQRDGDFVYRHAFAKGAEYRTWYRKPVASGAEVVLLDERELAAGTAYFNLGGLAVSPDQTLLAYATDTNGSERYRLRIRDLSTGEDLPDVIENWRFGLVWAADSRSFLYTDADENWRSKKLFWHRLGDRQNDDRVLYEEPAEEFGLSLSRSQSRDYAILSSGDNVTNEVRLLPTNDFSSTPMLVSPRQSGRTYDVDMRGETLYIRVNDTHVNFRIVTAPVADRERWQELIPGSDRHYLQSVTSFENILVIEERVEGLSQIRLHDYATGKEHYVSFGEPTYAAALGSNPEYCIDRLRLDYQSMVTPNTVFDYHLADGRLETMKVREIPSGFDKANYVSERLTFVARDGVRVPVSVVFRKDFKKDGSGKLHIYAYGSYGFAYPPGFSANRLSLLDRGFAYAIAHIRGGDDLGYQWYLDGKLEKRTNTFNDFIDATRFLIAEGFAKPGKVSASGGSAGGQLMGAIVNQSPELYGAVAAHVPFVDALNTMLDADLPLTPGEWPEWGNPIEDESAFHTIRSYSPYDNVAAQPYPAMLVTGGLHDPRVTYWEPAKWVAKLRASKTDNNLLLLKTNMGAGHGGKSGRYASLEEDAEEYAFLIDALSQAAPSKQLAE